MSIDESTASLAVLSAKMARESGDPQKFICEAGWCMLSLLHDQMESKGEITGLRALGQDKKLMWWTLACVGRPDGSKFKKISIAKALYVYSLITEKS